MHARSHKTAVAVFLKYPEPGRVKSRLAKDIGPERATDAYRQMLESILKNTLSPLPSRSFSIFLYCDPYRNLPDYEALLGEFPFALARQQGDDLGARLSNAFGDLLEEYQSAIAIGTDCIDVAPSHLEEARNLLSGEDGIVLGPATDGGYYLIGLQERHDEVFQNIRWSSPETLSDTTAAAGRAKLDVHALETLTDIDTVEDLNRSGLVA